MDSILIKSKNPFAIILALVLCLAGAPVCSGSTVVLTWGTDVYPGLSGYKVYYQQDSSTIPFTGTGATQGNSPVDVHNQTSATISGLDPSHGYYFAITAYSTAGLESPYSNLVYIPELIPPVVSLSSPANNATVTGTVSVAATAENYE